MGVVDLEDDLLDPDGVAVGDPGLVVEEAAVDPTGDGSPGAVEGDGPGLCPRRVEGVVEPLEDERHPADLAFGVGDL